MTHDAMTATRRRSIALVLGAVLLAPLPAAADPDGFNRANLHFNQWFLEHVMEPVGRGWNVAVPKWGQRRVVAFMENVVAPRDIINSLLQAKWKRAGLHTGRFVFNTVWGIGGLYDMANWYWGWTASPETTSETLGVWGVPPGNYLILPVIGDFCTRSLVGWVADGFMNPLSYVPGAPIAVATVGGWVTKNVNLLAQGMPGPCAPDGQWDAYRQSRFKFEPYEVGRDLFYQDEAERVAD